jgi:hypothetical protein
MSEAENQTTSRVSAKLPMAVAIIAVIAFAVGAWSLIIAFVTFANSSKLGAPALFLGVGGCVFGLLLIIGGIAAVQGKTDRILSVTARAYIIVMVISLCIALVNGHEVGTDGLTIPS